MDNSTLVDSAIEPEQREVVSVAIATICPFFLLYCQYVLHYNKLERTIRKRSIFYIRLATMAGWLAELNLIISLNIRVPCFVFYCAQLVIAPLAIGPQLLRSIRLWSMYKLSFLVLKQEVIRQKRDSRKGRASTSLNVSKHRAGTVGGADESEIKSSVEVAIEVTKVKELTAFALKVTSWGLISFPTLILIAISMVWAESDKPGILLETDFALCLPEPDSVLFISPVLGLIIAMLSLGGTFLMRNSSDELGIRIEIVR